MAIPVNLNIKTVKMAALKFAETADEESLHLETLVTTIPYAEAKAWQRRQCKLDEDRFCAFLQMLNETSESIDIPKQSKLTISPPRVGPNRLNIDE